MRRSWTAPSAPRSVGSELPPVDSNHHSRIQSPMSCRWTRGHQSPETYPPVATPRSEEHTSELQSQSNLVCRLLLEKKKKKHNPINLTCYTKTLYLVTLPTL